MIKKRKKNPLGILRSLCIKQQEEWPCFLGTTCFWNRDERLYFAILGIFFFFLDQRQDFHHLCLGPQRNRKVCIFLNQVKEESTCETWGV